MVVLALRQYGPFAMAPSLRLAMLVVAGMLTYGLVMLVLFHDRLAVYLQTMRRAVARA